MTKYYEVRFNNTSRKFENDKEAVNHAKALDSLGYRVEVVQVEHRLYITITKTIYQSLSFNSFAFFEDFERIANHHGGLRYDR